LIYFQLKNTLNRHRHSFETRLNGSTRGWNRAGLKKKRGKKKPGVTRRVEPATQLQSR
jgi:hypothetical protein